MNISTPEKITEKNLNARATQSRTSLLEVTFKQFSQPKPGAPNISDLVKQAGVSRPTFYQHFKDADGLMRAAAFEKLNQVFASLPPVEQEEVLTQQSFLQLLIRLQKEALFFRNIMQTSGNATLALELVGFIGNRLLARPSIVLELEAKTQGSSLKDYVQFIAAGVAWVTVRWLYSDFEGPNSPQAMSQRLTDLMRQALQ